METVYSEDSGIHKSLQYLAPRFFILAFGVLLSVSCFFYLTELDSQKALNQIESQNKQRALAIASNANDRMVVLRSLRSYIQTKETFTEHDFSQQASLFLDHYPDILAIEWAPRIPDALRADFERSMPATGAEPYQIRQYHSATGIKPSDIRQHYLPIQFVEPASERDAALGLDLFSVVHWRDQLQKAQNENTTVATAVTTLVQQNNTQTSVRIFYPVFDDEHLIKGFLTMVIELDSFIRNTLHGYGLSTISTELFDLNQQSKNPIYTWFGEQSGLTLSASHNSRSRVTIPFADRQWLVMSTPTQRFLNSQRSNAPRNLLLSGLLLTALAYICLHWSYRARLKLATNLAKLEEKQDIESRALQNKLIEKEVLSQALSDSEKRCRDVIALSRDYTWETDINNEYTFLSPQAAQIKGVPPKQLAGSNFFDCLAPEDRVKAEEALRSSQKNQSNIELALNFLSPSGEKTKELIRAVPLTDALGRWDGFRGTGHLLDIQD
ncbi:CHASE domain-containing protein [Alkalimarinus alittae]|uniref:CHASE domain-containing protein n=1 Tax=Alkalimarinus alittae TaxID=2961619 RepID=A0ABY6N3E7_9ALTE|nr:CHASE domain-containing protein [Alkalimarinus alittae]UZE96527.1 CHASE domain-containing protein [Alkalimarinus alittae]